MNCNTDILFKYIDNILSDEEELIVEEHINHCDRCRETYNTFKLLESLEETDDISIDVSSKVMESIDKHKYSKKNYWYFNKFLINKKGLYKFAAVAMVAIMVTTGVLSNKYIGSFIKGVNTANAIKQGNISPAANNGSKEAELGERFILSKDMVKAANINLILYDYKFTESDRINSQEINREIDKIEERTTGVTLKPYTPTHDLDSPIFKINIEYEKAKYEYYGYETKDFKEKTIVLQKYTGNIDKDKEFYLLKEDKNIIQELINKFAANKSN